MTSGKTTQKEAAKHSRAARDEDQSLNWVSRHVYSPLAVQLVPLLLRTNLSANQVTVLWIFLGVIGCILLTLPSRVAALVACGCLFLHTTLDFVDGTVARVRREISSNGVFLDRVGHDIIYPFSLFALAIRGSAHFPQMFILIIGFFAAHSFFLYNNIRRSKIISYLMFQRGRKYERLRPLLDQIGSGDEMDPVPSDDQMGVLRRAFRKIQWIWQPGNYLLILYICTLFNVLEYLPVFYAATCIPLFILAVHHQVRVGDRWVEPYLCQLQKASNWEQ